MRVPVTCASLLTDSAVAQIIGSAVKHRRDQSASPVDIVDTTQRQCGSLDCLWGGDPEDSGYDQYLSIDITPDAAAGFIAGLRDFSSEDPPTTLNTAGDKSVYGCTVDGDLHCSANMLVGSFWTTIYVQNLGAGPVSLPTADVNVQHLMETVATALASAKAGPVWNPPGAAVPTFCSAAASTAAVITALGTSDLAVTGHDDTESDAASYTQLRGVYSQCGWSSAGGGGPFTYLSVALLRGGAWVLPSLPAESNTRS